MAIGSTVVWGKFRGFLPQLFTERIRMKRIAIGGTGQAFTTYATNGVTYDICSAHGFVEASTFVDLEGDATYTYVYDKANNKIIFKVTTTGAELAGGTNISAVVIYGNLLGK